MCGTLLNAIRKALPCKSKPSDVSDPERSSSVGCLSNLKGTTTRHKERESNSSSKVQRKISTRYPKTNIVGNEMVLYNPGPSREGKASNGRMVKSKSKRVGNGGRAEGPHMVSRFKMEIPLFEHSREYCGGNSSVVCHICGQQHQKSSISAIDSNPVSKRYTVSKLQEGDSSRKIVEIICRTGQDEKQHIKMETILKVHNMQNILTWFEDYREMVKIKARKHPKKVDPRCLADGNELLRFYATNVACSLGSSSSGLCLCNLDKCGACRILRNGFSANKDFVGSVGIFATSTSERALAYVEAHFNRRKALFVCRVIAGKIRKFDQAFSHSGFDSLSWKVGRNREAEELFVLSPKAVLPCFLVICKI
uniref:Uncharacterized protein n=1 Tax=Cannabis sativa TaxID=3483 RepID=A0A803NYY5_CANSA